MSVGSNSLDLLSAMIVIGISTQGPGASSREIDCNCMHGVISASENTHTKQRNSRIIDTNKFINKGQYKVFIINKDRQK